MRFAGAILAILMFVSGASAATMQASFTGTITSGSDLTGLFGPTNAVLDGQSFFMSMIYITHNGTRTTVPGVSDTVTGRNVAILQQITVNGGSVFTNTFESGAVAAGASAWSFGAQQTLQNVLRRMRETITVSATLLDAFAGLPTSLNTPFQQSATGAAGSLGTGSFSYFGLFTDTGATYLNTNATFNLTGVNVTMLQPDPPPPPPVPLPATGLMMMAALAGAGIVRRSGRAGRAGKQA